MQMLFYLLEFNFYFWPSAVVIDAPNGFLFEWWSVFWEIFVNRTGARRSEAAVAYLKVHLFSWVNSLVTLLLIHLYVHFLISIVLTLVASSI